MAGAIPLVRLPRRLDFDRSGGLTVGLNPLSVEIAELRIHRGGLAAQ